MQYILWNIFLKGLFMGQEQHRATARVLDIVESLSEVQEGLTLTELAVALKAPKQPFPDRAYVGAEKVYYV